MTQVKTTSPKISILIVGYNSAEHILPCISAIPKACTQSSYETLFIDNGDGSTETLVAGAFPEVTILPGLGNIGFAAANNRLADLATGEYLLLLNPDVVLKPSAIDALISATSSHAEASAWGGVTLDRNGNPDLGNRVHIPSLRELTSRLTGRSRANHGAIQGTAKDTKVPVLSGSFAMFARNAWDKASGMDERYFLYCEEVDLFYRLAAEGHSFWRITEARAYHDIGHGELISHTRMLYRAAGTMQFARIHWNTLRQWLAFFLIWAGALQRLLIGRLLGAWTPHLANVANGHRDIALRPTLWRYGYDPERGLLRQLEAQNDKVSARSSNPDGKQ
ncbi:glycosyltransferase family 2 protein [Erythrobacter sp. F6033]|uniref:glycosyltransferase family 2 protein n=1 Tax=Erythrobacter sp. F6033 TaxID=2926401 RepID=UPI001FF5FD33|nr:glycosyltransferase family 2 protein [Erythrobacter sp. F6033]MCK0127195.1 glycosyltransferase family 2 protein [Erythrobacter sp. F6033]